jgi:hypothetical protein
LHKYENKIIEGNRKVTVGVLWESERPRVILICSILARFSFLLKFLFSPFSRETALDISNAISSSVCQGQDLSCTFAIDNKSGVVKTICYGYLALATWLTHQKYPFE